MILRLFSALLLSSCVCSGATYAMGDELERIQEETAKLQAQIAEELQQAQQEAADIDRQKVEILARVLELDTQLPNLTPGEQGVAFKHFQDSLQ